MTGRASPKRDAVLAVLRSNSAGATNAQLIDATRRSAMLINSMLKTLVAAGKAFVIPRCPRSLYFASVEAMEAARPAAVEALAAAKREAVAKRTTRRKLASQELSRVRKVQHVKAKAVRIKAPKSAKAVALKTWPQAEPIKPRIRPGPRSGWGPDDPMHITPNTVRTYCSAPLPSGFCSNTHSQF